MTILQARRRQAGYGAELSSGRPRTATATPTIASAAPSLRTTSASGRAGRRFAVLQVPLVSAVPNRPLEHFGHVQEAKWSRFLRLGLQALASVGDYSRPAHAVTP